MSSTLSLLARTTPGRPHYPWSPALPLQAQFLSCSQVCKILTGIALFYLVNFFQMYFAILPACSTLPVLPRPHYLCYPALPLVVHTTPVHLHYPWSPALLLQAQFLSCSQVCKILIGIALFLPC